MIGDIDYATVDDRSIDLSTHEWVESYVYRLRNRSGDLLYVGATSNWLRRFNEHARDKPWWPEITHFEIDTYANPVQARMAEMRALEAEPARHSKAGQRSPMVPYSPRRTHKAKPAPAIPLALIPPAPEPAELTLEQRISNAITKLTAGKSGPPGIPAGQVTRNVIDGIPRRLRRGSIRAAIMDELRQLSADPDSPIQMAGIGINPVNKTPVLRCWIGGALHV